MESKIKMFQIAESSGMLGLLKDKLKETKHLLGISLKVTSSNN